MTILSNGHQWKFSEFLDNKNYSFDKKQILNSLSEKEIDDAYSSISKWDGYAPTPLISLNKLSKELNLNNIYYKDESKRFDLKSFKALGGAYAVEKVTQGNKDIVVATATAGNHGRSVAWEKVEEEDKGLSAKFLLANLLVKLEVKPWQILEQM